MSHVETSVGIVVILKRHIMAQHILVPQTPALIRAITRTRRVVVEVSAEIDRMLAEGSGLVRGYRFFAQAFTVNVYGPYHQPVTTNDVLDDMKQDSFRPADIVELFVWTGLTRLELPFTPVHVAALGTEVVLSGEFPELFVDRFGYRKLGLITPTEHKGNHWDALTCFLGVSL